MQLSSVLRAPVFPGFAAGADSEESQADFSRLARGNLGNISDPVLYQYTRCGTKRLIERYLQEVCAALDYICDVDLPELSLQRSLEFMEGTSQAFGHSCLMLRGGTALEEERYCILLAARLTWPYVEMIRNATSISRKFRECLQRLRVRCDAEGIRA